jgi:hypothetical protein
MKCRMIISICLGLGALFAVTSPEVYAQTFITRIEVHIVTTLTNGRCGGSGCTEAPSGTDSNVYLGIGGREFNLDTLGDDFQPGLHDTFIFGEGSNSLNGTYDLNINPNDPNTARRLTLAAPFTFPVYIRMSELKDDDWWVNQIEVRIFSGLGTNRLLRGIWVLGSETVGVRLGRRFGFRLYLSEACGRLVTCP